MCYYMDCVQAIQTMDAANDTTFEGNATDTIFFAFTLMDIQKNYADAKENARTQAVIYGLMPGGGNAALAGYWTGLYNILSSQGDSVAQQWQGMAQGNQSQISSDFDEKKANLSVADGLASSLSACNGFIVSVT